MVAEVKYVIKNFKMKDLSELKYNFCLKIVRFVECIVLEQRNYALELISEVGLLDVNPSKTPMEVNQCVSYVAFE